MKVFHEQLSDISRYIENNKDISIEDREDVYEGIFSRIRKFKELNQDSKLFEVGTGTGWIPIMCKLKGLNCKGIEISPHLVEFSKELGKKYNVDPEIVLGNIEDTNIGESEYDVILANCSFEHIEFWQAALEQVFRALKPGGLFFFYSTNKFAFKSGEYNFPLYSWYPDSWRYRLRMARQGDDIMKLGIDFNEFTYFQLRSFFRKLGFSQVLDRADLIDDDRINAMRPPVGFIVRMIKKSRILKELFLLFYPETLFVCIK